MFKNNFFPCGNSSTMIRFLIALFISFPIFIFIGCPMRLCQRIAGGDPSIWTALLGLIAGIWTGTYFLKKGFTFGKTEKISYINSYFIGFIFIIILLLIFIKPYFIVNSINGHAHIFISLCAGVLIGILGQRTKLCFIGGFRNLFSIGDITLLTGFISFTLSAFITNVILGIFHPGKHIIGCDSNFWNFLSMFAAGFGFTLLGGCPFRQITLTAGGNVDSAFVLLAILIGAAISYNTDIAYTGQAIELQGKIALIITIFILFVIAYLFTFNKKNDLS